MEKIGKFVLASGPGVWARKADGTEGWVRAWPTADVVVFFDTAQAARERATALLEAGNAAQSAKGWGHPEMSYVISINEIVMDTKNRHVLVRPAPRANLGSGFLTRLPPEIEDAAPEYRSKE